MSNYIRSYFSGNRNRFVNDDFNLDLTYITDRIIAMGFPSSRFESVYRNNIQDVVRFLNSKHGDNYLIINLSDREYNYALFGNRVINAGFPDHHSPSLALMWSLYSIIDFWMAIDEKHVIAVHCLAGKGRTGLSIICTLLMQGFFNDFSCKTTLEVINAAINFFHDKRGDGVENPDQIRFIYHFLKSMNSMGSDFLLSSNQQLQPEIFISDLLFYNFPVGIGDSVVPRLEIYVKARNSRDLVYSSDWSFSGNPVITSFQPAISIRINQVFSGDLLFIMYDHSQPLFHFSLSTLLLPKGTLKKPKSTYLNYRCISFEKEGTIPFSLSFATQVICFGKKGITGYSINYSLIGRKNQQSILFDRIRDQAITSHSLNNSLVSRASSSSSVLSEHTPITLSDFPPLLCRGAKEPPQLQTTLSSSINSDLAISGNLLLKSKSKSLPSTPINLSKNESCLSEVVLASKETTPEVKRDSFSSQRCSSLHTGFTSFSLSFSNLSLSYGTQILTKQEELSFAFPTGKEAIKHKRMLTPEERQILNSEDSCCTNLLPIDISLPIILVNISPTSTSSSSSSSSSSTPALGMITDEIEITPSKTSVGFNIPTSPIVTLYYLPVLCKTHWKEKLVVVTEKFIRIMKHPTKPEVKQQIEIGSIKRPVITNFNSNAFTEKQSFLLVLSSEQSGKEQTVYFKCSSFPEIQSLFIQLCNLRKDDFVLPTLNVDVTESGVQWLCYLYNIPLEKQEIKEKVKDKNQLQELLAKTFGLSLSVFEDIDCNTGTPLSLPVVQSSGLCSLQHYVQLPKDASEEEGYLVNHSSFSMIMTKLKEFYDLNTFHRLVQISMIQYPSPDPVIRAVLKKCNEDWVVLFDKDPKAFYQVLQNSIQPIYRSLSSRSYKNKQF